MKKYTARQLCVAALIAALYAGVTMAFGQMAFSPMFQVRPAEALTILPILFVEAIPGVVIGCMIANIVSVFGPADIIFGTLITLVAAILTRLIKKPVLAALPPVLLNAFLLPIIWWLAGGDSAYWLNMLSTLLTQSLWIFGLGLPLHALMKKLKPKIYPELMPPVSSGTSVVAAASDAGCKDDSESGQ